MPNDFLEKTLEDIIFENKESISERGFPFLLDNTLRQFALPSGKKIDLFSYSISENSLCCKIFELKRECLKVAHVLQVLDYSNEIFFMTHPSFENVSIERFIVGNDIDSSTVAVVEDIHNLETYLYKFLYNGLYFKKYASKWEFEPEVLNKMIKPSTDHEKFKLRLEEIDKNRLSR